MPQPNIQPYRTVNIRAAVHERIKQEVLRMRSGTPWRVSISAVTERLLERALSLPEDQRYPEGDTP